MSRAATVTKLATPFRPFVGCRESEFPPVDETVDTVWNKRWALRATRAKRSPEAAFQGIVLWRKKHLR
jgi:hypothetical protein